jgi:hypothetical protein
MLYPLSYERWCAAQSTARRAGLCWSTGTAPAAIPGQPHPSSTVSESDDLIMIIGLACSGMPLEIGILGPASDDPVVIHAMWLRPKFQRFLR